MSGVDKIVGVLKSAGDNAGLLTAVSQIAGLFENVPAVGSLGKAAATLTTIDAVVRAATGGKHTVLGAAAQAVEKAGPKFSQVVETCIGAACSAKGEGKIQAAVAGLKGHLEAGAKAVASGASGVIAQATGKGATRA